MFATGCGSGETGSADLPGALGYAPADAFAVVLLPTDFEGDQLRRLEHLLGPALRESGAGSLREALVDTRGEVDYRRDIEPLLGDTLVIAASGDVDDPDVIAALETPDAAKAEATARKLEDTTRAPTGRHC